MSPDNTTLATIIIPVYQPEEVLLRTVLAIRERNPLQPILVIDDGSNSASSQQIFQSLRELNITVLEHSSNLGKGEALKTGFAYFLAHADPASPGVVTADADGQHRALDILKLCKALKRDPDSLHLGVRKFNAKATPWRSRVGNFLSMFVFRRISHTSVSDTQTGLRGIPRRFLSTLVNSKLSGYEFELEMLLRANQQHFMLHEITVKTVYEADNSSSHFRPILDSLKIYFVFLRFSVISIASAVLDYTLFSIGFMLGHKIFLAIVSARIISALFNFGLNKNIVFKDKGRTSALITKYAALAVALVLGSYLLTVTLHKAGINVYVGKLIAEFTLFVVSFMVQRIFIFR